jgi:hypothetical protein
LDRESDFEIGFKVKPNNTKEFRAESLFKGAKLFLGVPPNARPIMLEITDKDLQLMGF